MEPRQEMCSKWESLRSRNGKHPESKFRAVSQLLSEACSDGTGNACVQHGGGTNRPTRRQMEKPFQGPLTSKTQPIPSPRQPLCLSLTASQKVPTSTPTNRDWHTLSTLSLSYWPIICATPTLPPPTLQMLHNDLTGEQAMISACIYLACFYSGTYGKNKCHKQTNSEQILPDNLHLILLCHEALLLAKTLSLLKQTLGINPQLKIVPDKCFISSTQTIFC